MSVKAISPLSYGSSSIPFAGKMNPGMLTRAKSAIKPGTRNLAMAAVGLVATALTLFGTSKVNAQTPVGNAKATTVALTDAADKSILFAKESFDLFSEDAAIGKRLTLYVMNSNGDKSCFDDIIGGIYDPMTGKEYSGRVISLSEHSQSFRFADFQSTKILAEVRNEEAYEWVANYVKNAKRNASKIIVRSAQGQTAMTETAAKSNTILADATK